jgi:Lon protease-like protein
MENLVGAIELPLFLLNTVLFPGQVLPLHIFEDRYRLMIRGCLAEDKPFGVVLIQRGQEVGDTVEPYRVGTIARIVESSHLPDGAMNIVCVGAERFRILRLIHDQPYLRGEVESFPMSLPGDSQAVTRLTDQVRQQVVRYIELIAEAAGLRIRVDAVPDTPQQVGYLAAVAMQIDNQEKQMLLGAATVRQILAAETVLLNRENALLAWMARTKAWPDRAQFGSSRSLLPN